MGKNKRKPNNFKKQPTFQFDDRGESFKRSKRLNPGYEQSAGDSSGAETIYRLLCPARKIGGVIGKGGDIIKSLRDETGAKIKVGETIPGTDERVVIIFSSSTKKPRTYNINNNPEDEEQPTPENDVPSEKEEESMPLHCSAQDALLKVHQRIAEEEDLYRSILQDESTEDEIVTARLLVPNNQVGCLLGKGGHVIKKLRDDTGANIRILAADHLPACAMTTDELVQISGATATAKRALYEVSTLLYQNPRPPMGYPVLPGGDGFLPPGVPMAGMPPQENQRWGSRNSDFHGPPPMPWGGRFGNEFRRFASDGFSGPPAGHAKKASAEFSMKILCPTEKIGWVIGKGGSKVMQIQNETGAKIHVEETSPGSDERVILVTSFDAPWNPKSPTIEAILQIQFLTNSKEGVITTRLLVPSSKVGCLLGQGGHIINEMRKRTQADIRIMSDDGKPNFAPPDEELVQIHGNIDIARYALTEIASRLRMRSLEGISAAVESGPVGPFQKFGPPESFPPRGLPPSGMIGAGSSGGYEHAKGGGHGYGAPPAGTARYPKINSSMAVKIPNVAVNSVLGVGGSNVSNIGQMSGAKVKLNSPQSASSECIVEIHGSSEQMHAAQNLLQSFISSAVQSYNTEQPQVPYSSAGRNFSTHQQPTPYASTMQHSNLQQQHSPYTSVPNFYAQQQQQSPYPSAQNFNIQQQRSPYASTVQNYNMHEQSPYASAAQNFNAPQQQNPYSSAVQNIDQQQQQNSYASATKNFESHQQQKPYASAVQNFESHQQQNPYATVTHSQQQQDPYASATENFDSQQQQNAYASAAQNFDSQQQQNAYASAALNFDSQQQTSHASAAQNFNAHQQYQQQGPYVAIQSSYTPQQQSSYAPAVQNYDVQQPQGTFQY